MEKAYSKIEPVILELAEKYKLEKDQISLVGVGGGAASLIVYFSEKMGVKYSIPENAEVISSIGAALAMVRDVVERIIPSTSKDDIKAIKNEAMNKAIESGATSESVEIHVEIDQQTSKVTAIATGSTEVKATDLTKEIDDATALEIASEDMRLQPSEVEVVAKSKFFYVFGEKNRDNKSGAIRIIDKKGFIKVQRGNAMCLSIAAKNYTEAIERLWDEMAVYQTELISRPEYYLCLGARVVDFSATELDQLKILTDLEVSSLEPEEEVIIVAGNIKQT